MFKLPSSTFVESNNFDVVRRTYTILTYSEEQFCFSLIQSSDEQLEWNIKALDEEGLSYTSILFTNSEGLGLFVKTEFAIDAMFSEAYYRGLNV